MGGCDRILIGPGKRVIDVDEQSVQSASSSMKEENARLKEKLAQIERDKVQIAAKAQRSSIQDVDYAEASSEFAKQETALNAALATFPKVTELSLFNFI